MPNSKGSNFSGPGSFLEISYSPRALIKKVMGGGDCV